MKYSLYLARKYAAEGWWDRSIRHYLTVLYTYQDVEQREIEFAEEFRTVLESWMCYSRNADSCLSALFAPILNLFPKCVPIVTLLSEHVSGSALFLEDSGETGVCSYDNLSAAINAECDQLMGAVFRVSSANMRSGVFDQWHMFMINDQERNSMFFDALKNTISPNDHVLDIGTGTGILSIYAARCGASKITAIEANPTLYQMAKRILALNGVGNVKVVQEYSYEYDPEEDDLADVVVSEILDCCAFGEGVIPAFLDAHLRLATNTARFIPSNVTLFATLLESPSVYLSHSFTSPSGKEYRSEYVPCNGQKPPEPYWCIRVSDLADAKHLSAPHQLLGVDFQNVNELHRYVFGQSGVIKISTHCSGTLHAVAVHFKALIWGDQYIDTSKSTCWEQGIFPLPYPMRVNEGDVVVLNWTLKRTRLDISVDLIQNSEEIIPSRELIPRSQLDYRTMNNDMLLFAITRMLPSVSRYSWNLDGELSAEELGIVRYLPHFLIDSKDIHGAVESEVDEGYADQCVVVWPIRGDGSVSEVFLNLLRTLRARNDIPLSLKHCGFLTDRLSAHGVLVSSERLSKLTRVREDSLCGADLSPIRMYNLLEYRDIEISTFEHQICSNEFRFLHLGEEDTELLSKKIEVKCTSAGLVEGVLYWWQLDQYYSTRQDRGTFFIFREPISVNVGTLLNITCDVYCGSILLSAEIA
nr:Methyltransferase type 11 domain containing protein [Haemonchus contortus]